MSKASVNRLQIEYWEVSLLPIISTDLEVEVDGGGGVREEDPRGGHCLPCLPGVQRFVRPRWQSDGHADAHARWINTLDGASFLLHSQYHALSQLYMVITDSSHCNDGEMTEVFWIMKDSMTLSLRGKSLLHVCRRDQLQHSKYKEIIR
ncbi:hypothetical protein SAY87_011061 [Trapa incisa]|uniref:Uncharacterized protein n=1 Tax=Trapa incisa TaxID=236973 RepID=A0AAN7GVP1_9MYRT|nr:hypothetical protein SAY87_011061 [Trapa incisa]